MIHVRMNVQKTGVRIGEYMAELMVLLDGIRENTRIFDSPALHNQP